jgi:large conductance mechanosensitive channel
MGMVSEFKQFIARGNVMDMAVGIIMGASFTSIVKSMVDDVLMPVIGLLTGGVDFSKMFLNISGRHYDTLADAKAAGAATINYGMFINACVSFFIVSFVVFMLLRSFNKLKEKIERAPKSADIPPPADILLLTEIRDLLKKQK